MMKKNKLFRTLRRKMDDMDIDQGYLAERLNLSVTSLSYRMTGKQPWKLNEMYIIMDLIHEPYDKLHGYFPKNGKTK
jgi:hypothetical protein